MRFRTELFIYVASLILIAATAISVGVYERTTSVPPQWKWCAQLGGVLFYPHGDAAKTPYCVRLEQVP